MELPQSGHEPDGSITSKQVAVVFLPRAELERIWTPEYLERLARTYWRFLSRVSLGLLRVVYGPDSREIVVLTKPFVLLSFRKPEYDIDADAGTVTWRIEQGPAGGPGGPRQGLPAHLGSAPARGGAPRLQTRSRCASARRSTSTR